MKPILLYLATGHGPVVITQDNKGWQVIRTLELRETADADSVHACVACGPHQPLRAFYALPEHGVWRTDDGGQTWQEVFHGLPRARVTALAVSAPVKDDEPEKVYVGTELSALFSSRDGGETWWRFEEINKLPSSVHWSFPPRPESHHVRWIQTLPRYEERLLVAIEAGALVSSHDGGRSWHDREQGSPIDTHQIAVHRDAPQHLWSAAGDGIFESADGGLTWGLAQEGLRFNYGWSVAIDSGDPQTVILSAAPDAQKAHGMEAAEAALYRRCGQGAWEEIHDGLPGSNGMLAPVIAASPAEPGVFYAAASGGLYRSADAGKTWAAMPVDLNLPPHSRIHALAVASV